jgi:hypothetical protein
MQLDFKTSASRLVRNEKKREGVLEREVCN